MSEVSASFNTAFVALDESELGAFIHASFRALEHHAKGVIKNKGVYQIQVTIEGVENLMDKAQAMDVAQVA